MTTHKKAPAELAGAFSFLECLLVVDGQFGLGQLVGAVVGVAAVAVAVTLAVVPLAAVTVVPLAAALLVFGIAALLGGNAALALGPWLVRLTDTGPVAAGFWRMLLPLPLFAVLARRELSGGLRPSRQTVLLLLG